MRWRGLLAGLAVVGFVTLLPATSASAHPLGNFTVNQHSGLVVGAGRITVELVVDMAEIPTFQARSDIDTDGDRTVSPGEASAYRQRACAEQVQGIELRFDDEPLTATVASSDLTFPARRGRSRHPAAHVPGQRLRPPPPRPPRLRQPQLHEPGWLAGDHRGR